MERENINSASTILMQGQSEIEPLKKALDEPPPHEVQYMIMFDRANI
jgi:hypothetical protein